MNKTLKSILNLVIIVVVFIMLSLLIVYSMHHSTGDEKQKKAPKYESVSEIKILTVEGDTVIISTHGSGQICRMKKRNK